MRRILCVLVVGLLLGMPVSAFGYSLTQGDPIAEPHPTLINGMNFGNWMIVYDLLEEYNELKIPLLRFPAGNYGDDHLLSEASLRLFMMVVRDMGAIPMVQHNIFKGDVAEAVKWVEYAKANDFGIKYWFIGNEPDLFGTNRGAPQWTAEYYSEQFREYAMAIKEVDPDAKVIGPVVAQTPNELWIKTFLNIAGDLVDILAWQWYPSDGSMDEKQALASAAAVGDHIRMFREWISDPAVNPKGYEREIPLFLSEFGLSWRTNHARLLTDMTSALWLAEVWGEMVLAELEYAAYFALQGTGGHGLYDVALWPRPAYFVSWMLSKMGPVWHEVLGTGPRDKMVAYSSQAGNSSVFMVVNKEREAVEVAFPEAISALEVFWIDDQDQEEIHTAIYQEKELLLPPYSVSLVIFH